jgi:DNA-binding MarR family transcriptional regulator
MNGPGDALAMRLIGAAHAVEARLEAALEPLGLSLAKFGVLKGLVDAGEPLALCGLAHRLACVRSNITQLMDRLEADGLVVRAADPRDRRSIRAEITKEGRARHAAAARALVAAEREVFARLPERQREALARLVSAMEPR